MGDVQQTTAVDAAEGALFEYLSHGSLEVSDAAGGADRVLRALLAPMLHGPKLEAAILMLSGAILNAAMLHGQPPADDVIAAAVDIVLDGAH